MFLTIEAIFCECLNVRVILVVRIRGNPRFYLLLKCWPIGPRQIKRVVAQHQVFGRSTPETHSYHRPDIIDQFWMEIAIPDIDLLEPFQLRAGITVVTPSRWARALLRSLDTEDARCRTGAAQRDLENFLGKSDGEKSK